MMNPPNLTKLRLALLCSITTYPIYAMDDGESGPLCQESSRCIAQPGSIASGIEQHCADPEQQTEQNIARLSGIFAQMHQALDQTEQNMARLLYERQPLNPAEAELVERPRMFENSLSQEGIWRSIWNRMPNVREHAINLWNRLRGHVTSADIGVVVVVGGAGTAYCMMNSQQQHLMSTIFFLLLKNLRGL